MASLVTVARYYDPADALVAQSCLRAHGLIAFLPEQHHAATAWHITLSLQGVRLQTLDSMVGDAKALLDAADSTPLPTIRKPVLRLFGHRGRTFDLLVCFPITMLLLLTSVVPPFILRRKWRESGKQE